MCKLKMQPGTSTFLPKLVYSALWEATGYNLTLQWVQTLHNKILKYPENCIISSDYQFYVKS